MEDTWLVRICAFLDNVDGSPFWRAIRPHIISLCLAMEDALSLLHLIPVMKRR